MSANPERDLENALAANLTDEAREVGKPKRPRSVRDFDPELGRQYEEVRETVARCLTTQCAGYRGEKSFSVHLDEALENPHPVFRPRPSSLASANGCFMALFRRLLGR